MVEMIHLARIGYNLNKGGGGRRHGLQWCACGGACVESCVVLDFLLNKKGGGGGRECWGNEKTDRRIKKQQNHNAMENTRQRATSAPRRLLRPRMDGGRGPPLFSHSSSQRRTSISAKQMVSKKMSAGEASRMPSLAMSVCSSVGVEERGEG